MVISHGGRVRKALGQVAHLKVATLCLFSLIKNFFLVPLEYLCSQHNSCNYFWTTKTKNHTALPENKQFWLKCFLIGWIPGGLQMGRANGSWICTTSVGSQRERTTNRHFTIPSFSAFPVIKLNTSSCSPTNMPLWSPWPHCGLHCTQTVVNCDAHEGP